LVFGWRRFEVFDEDDWMGFFEPIRKFEFAA
jgi:hypothetical protein